MAHKTTALFLGLPIAGIIISTFTVFSISYFFGYTFYLSALALSLLLIISPQIKKRGHVLKLHSYSFLPQKIIVSGLPDSFLSDIDKTIQSNKKVIVGLPLDRLLRIAISQYVSERYGLLEIVDSGDIVVGSDELPPTSITLSAFGKDTLNEKVDVLKKRGWHKVDLPQSFIKGLSIKISQNMEYKPL